MRRWCFHIALLCLWGGSLQAAKPTFENGTPVGFSVKDSTTRQDFVTGQEISVRVDLNQAATYEYPVVGHFHSLEKSVRIDAATNATDGMQVDIAMVEGVPFGTNSNLPEPGDSVATHPVIHMAWIEETTSTPKAPLPYTGGSTPVYRVMYSRSFDGGATFSTPVKASKEVTFHLVTTSNDAFSTLDLEIDSGGNPRVAYAFISTADRVRKKNVYLSYSNDGGGSWNDPVQVNPQTVAVTENSACAFPRMAIDDRDQIFITYVRGIDGAAEDVMLAKVNRVSDPYTIVHAGTPGAAGTGGVRIAPDGDRHVGPDIAIGDGDALHLIYYNANAGDHMIEHKRLATDTTWVDGSASGWNQDVDGAQVKGFVDDGNASGAVETEARHFFPTVVVDRLRSPDRVYALFKYGGAADRVEGIYINQYSDNGVTGAGAGWGTASSVWSTAPSPVFADGGSYNIELDWEITERVAAVVDDRLEDRGDLHIAFTAGYSGGGEHDIYYARYNGTSWTLPEKVADDDSDGTGTQDGIDNADVFLLSPALAQHPDSEKLFMAFAGGSGEGFGVSASLNVNHHAYFKVLGRDLAWEDHSVPAGGYQYDLTYTPVNPHAEASEVADNPVFVHAADPANGRGLGARADSSDGFLAGDWERVGATSLGDSDKYFEGKSDEASGTASEWGDNGDKVGLLLKLNVLGSDSSRNLQVITASSAAVGPSVTVGADPTGSFVSVGSFFALGADIDIVPSSSAPTASIAQPDGTGDQANTEYTIEYSVNDANDDLCGNLKVALYAFPSNGLDSVQEIRIFGTLIADENDAGSSGTGDLTEGSNQTYTWDDPPSALVSSALFASILRVESGNYYIYIVADDGTNEPVFAVSPGPVTLRHSPIVRQVDPTAAETVDTGVRTGLQANPYDLDFSVVDYDSQARVQLFYASVSGITSVSVKGTYPHQKFVLGKSVAGTRGTAIIDSTTLTSRDTEYTWDVTTPLVSEGSYYLYAVASDSISVSVGNSSSPLTVRHSPSFVFYEPGKDTQRSIDSGSQPVYAIQWQKGPGDQDLDHDATIDLYFTTDDPAATDHSTDAGASTTSLTSDTDTRLIVSGLKENSDGEGDIYLWNLREPPNDVPRSDRQVWIYAVVTDSASNVTVARGGSLKITHNPYILLESRIPSISQGDILRLEWDDYMVDDGSGTDDAYLRLYASPNATHTTLQSLEASGDTYIINSSDGTASGTIASIREDSSNAFNWDTWTSGLALPQGNYSIYAGISADPTFSDNTTGQVSKASNQLVVGVGIGTTPNLSLSPSKVGATLGDTLTFEVMVQSGGQAAESVSVVIDLNGLHLLPVDSGSPFTDLGEVFSGGTVEDNSTSSYVLRFSKRKGAGEVIGSSQEQKRLASFRVTVDNGFSGRKSLSFDHDETALSISGSSVPLKKSSGLSVQNAQLDAVSRGSIAATVLLEGRSGPLGDGNHATLLDVHLRLPGSTDDVADSRFKSGNDDLPATPDTVEVQTSSDGLLTLNSVPAGRYVLTVKDTSHLSGRTDTLTIRNGETITLSSSQGFFASDIRGDPSFLLSQGGRQLKAGDVSEDNEIDEDDVNVIDAAWGSNAGVANFKQADLNNDGRVGVEDLTVTSSNISNSTGFGAPPVFKRAAPGSNAGAAVEILAPGREGEWLRGDEVELLFVARDLGDLAGYGFELEFDPLEMELVEGGVRVAELFRGNRNGFFGRVEKEDGRLAVAAARRGREWSAAGTGELLRVKIRLHRDGFPSSLELRDGRLMSSEYETTAIRLLDDPRKLALPREFALRQNYPNPFNPSTTIPFAVPMVEGGIAPVSVEIFNALGQRVRTLLDDAVEPGYYRMLWDGRNGNGQTMGTGIYFYRVRIGEMVQARKMMLVK